MPPICHSDIVSKLNNVYANIKRCLIFLDLQSKFVSAHQAKIQFAKTISLEILTSGMHIDSLLGPCYRMNTEHKLLVE